MTITQIEYRAREAIDRAKSRRPSEDVSTELKSDWITDYRGAARRIAAQANAARGEPIILVFGVDEKAGNVVGASAVDMADWWPQVRKHFDGFAPPPRDHVFEVDGKPVVALQFDTDGAPFVVRTGAAGEVTHEIPWREGTRIRSAGRAELLKILVPAVQSPDVEFLSMKLALELQANAGPNPLTTMPYVWRALIDIYVAPRAAGSVTFPVHLCEMWIRADKSAHETSLVCGLIGDGGGVKSVAGSAIVEGPGTLSIRGNRAVQKARYVAGREAELRLSLQTAGRDKTIELEGGIRWLEDKSPQNILWGDWHQSLIAGY